jgi:hypothetical protein
MDTDNRQTRQGDVMQIRGARIENGRLVPLQAVPANLKPAARNEQHRVALAYGEVTGHAHAIHEKGVACFTKEGDDIAMAGGGVMQLSEPARLVHEEHSTIPLPPGLYEVIRQREFPRGEISRMVAD